MLAESDLAAGWLIAAALLFMRDYGWMLAVGGFIVVWLLRKVDHPVIAVLMVFISTTSSLLLPTSMVLNCVTFANKAPKKVQPPVEVRKAQ